MIKKILKFIMTEKQWQEVQEGLKESMPYWETKLIQEENKAIIMHELTIGRLIKKLKGGKNE